MGNVTRSVIVASNYPLIISNIYSSANYSLSREPKRKLYKLGPRKFLCYKLQYPYSETYITDSCSDFIEASIPQYCIL